MSKLLKRNASSKKEAHSASFAYSKVTSDGNNLSTVT